DARKSLVADGRAPEQDLEVFIAASGIDDRAADTLRGCPPHVQQAVMARGDLTTAKNPSAAMLARIRDAEKGGGDGGCGAGAGAYGAAYGAGAGAYGAGAKGGQSAYGAADGPGDAYAAALAKGGYGGKNGGYGGKGAAYGAAYGGKDSGYGGMPSAYGGKDLGYGGKAAAYGGKDFGYGGKDSGYGGKDTSYGGKDFGYGGKDTSYGGYGGKDAGYGGKGGGYGGKAGGYGAAPPAYGGAYGAAVSTAAKGGYGAKQRPSYGSPAAAAAPSARAPAAGSAGACHWITVDASSSLVAAGFPQEAPAIEFDKNVSAFGSSTWILGRPPRPPAAAAAAQPRRCAPPARAAAAAAAAGGPEPPPFARKPPPRPAASPVREEAAARHVEWRLPTPPPPPPPGPELELPAARLPRRALSQSGVDLVDRIEQCSGGRRPERASSERPRQLSPLRRDTASSFASRGSWAPDAGPPLVRGCLPAFQRPQAYTAALRAAPVLQRPPPLRERQPAARAQLNPLDAAVRRQFLGEGLSLNQAVASRRDAGWAVKQRHLQKSDVGHCCHSCRQPLRDLNEEVTVWTGAAIYRRFHPACAASFILKTGGCEEAPAASGSSDDPRADVVEGYADGWRAPRERNIQAARQWLLSQDPGAYPALRGDLFTTVTVTDEHGVKKAVPGLSADQVRLLRTRHAWTEPEQQPGDEADGPLECAVCFGPPEPGGPPCIQLPCAPQPRLPRGLRDALAAEGVAVPDVQNGHQALADFDQGRGELAGREPPHYSVLSSTCPLSLCSVPLPPSHLHLSSRGVPVPALLPGSSRATAVC
ncbi:unnamed protein product, partial [Prorocentrum cordatum]